MIKWDDADVLIKTKRLDKLVRSPEQSAIYHAAKSRFKESHGGTAEYVINERLRWNGPDAISSSKSFMEKMDDIKILKNDFPYDFEPGIQHLIVWSKVFIPCGEDDLPTPESEAQIEKFLYNYFTLKFGVPRSNILWFKNTLVLQSIPNISHFHVLLRNCSDADVNKIIQQQ